LSFWILALYYLVLGTLAAYGLHRLLLVWDYLRSPAPPPAPHMDEPSWPAVTVQLPIYNERYVAERLIDAVCNLDYPANRLEIQVLDDSADDTAELARARVAAWQAAGADVVLLHRESREGYKAGALEAGQKVAKGELVAIFDADFVPPHDFLRRAVPIFRDPAIGMVQARWGHLNREDSLLTKVQAMLLDGHFVIEHAARHRSGCLFNFNGTAGVWRRRAIEDAGGWQHDTLTEDLDLSYRAQLRGWRFHYQNDLVVPAELPIDIDSLKSQQHRWAKGSVQTCRKLLWEVLRAPLSKRAKLEAAVHLTANNAYLLMVLLSLLVFPAMVFRQGEEAWKLLLVDLPLFAAATAAIAAFFLASQNEPAKAWKRLPALMALGIGLAVNNSQAVLAGWKEKGGVFHRTPKYREAQAKPSYRPGRNSSLPVESLLAAYFAACFSVAVMTEMWLSLPFLWLFLQGYGYVTWLGLARRQASG
jgi:cellulose synthase/poly-beta-1,6-N-acetylglucosamine synthase-like glycosyltransferase